MAHWSKRRTTKGGNQGQRNTRTLNTNGTSTYSYSKKVGPKRTTITNRDGKFKEIVTEHHPTLGIRRTVRTINPEPSNHGKSRNSKSNKLHITPVKYEQVQVSRTYKNPYQSEINEKSSGWFLWGITALILLYFGMPWYIWLIYFSILLKNKVDLFK